MVALSSNAEPSALRSAAPELHMSTERCHTLPFPELDRLLIEGPVHAVIRVDPSRRAGMRVTPLTSAGHALQVNRRGEQLRVRAAGWCAEHALPLRVEVEVKTLSELVLAGTAVASIEDVAVDHARVLVMDDARCALDTTAGRWDVDVIDRGQALVEVQPMVDLRLTLEARAVVHLIGATDTLHLHANGDSRVRALGPDFATEHAVVALRDRADVRLCARGTIRGAIAPTVHLEVRPDQALFG